MGGSKIETNLLIAMQGLSVLGGVIKWSGPDGSRSNRFFGRHNCG